ncbi:MAG: cobalamin biosynthesis protein CobW [Merismopedia sp. SIO2A8]|nr:cobalamin biosynthesis protein CobW [Symploca sp. SIO2B6]NET53150.1 cobalamin biosynthesis protein CobW [Merismopedia sp. SIO2A8]
MHKIPVTVITGFLGSGKTTLVRHLLQNNGDRRIAVIVNEFGEVGIDGDLLRSCQVCDEGEAPGSAMTTGMTNIVELNNGCLCCTVQEEFLPTMQALLQRRTQIDHIVIETSGLALPKPLVQAFRWPEIRTGATVDGVVTLVDGEAIANGELASDLGALDEQRQADPNLDHETPIEELFEDQLACADLVILTKVDQLKEGTQQRVETWLQPYLPTGVKVVANPNGHIHPDVLLGFNAAVEDSIDQRPSHHDHEDEHDHDDQMMSIQVLLDQAFDPDTLVERLKELTQTHEIYRIKGFVNVSNKPMRLVLHGVGQRFNTFYDRRWTSDELRQTKLVVIGHDLCQETIEAAILGRSLALT